MTDLTREQESAIARLAIEHPSVAVEPQEDSTVKVEAGGRMMILDEDGNTAPEPITHGYVRIPVETLRRLLGDERMAEMLAEAAKSPYPEHALNSAFGGEMCEALDGLVRARECDGSGSCEAAQHVEGCFAEGVRR